MNVHLDEIIGWIDRAFGTDEALRDSPATATQLESLQGLLGEDAYQRYLRDQVNRQIIRDYLTNAVVLGVISEGGLAAFAAPMSTEEGRSTLALYMLMSAVEDAADLPPACSDLEVLKPSKVSPGDRSHIKLVPN